MNLSEKLYHLRKEKKVTQLELAEELNVSRQAISRWEMGESYPSVENLLQIGRFYDVSVDYLVNDDYIMDENMKMPEEKRKKTKSNYKEIIKKIIIVLAFTIIAITIAFYFHSVYSMILFITLSCVLVFIVYIVKLLLSYLINRREENIK